MRVIAIDGPAGAGKSTIARALAERLGLDYLDTGAQYRGVTFAALRLGIDPDSEEEVARLATALRLEVTDDGVFVDGADATVEIRGPEVTRAVGTVAANQAVRAELRRRQREWADAHGGGVIEGRDIGSVVFPDAELKLYLDASVETRARRRYKELADLDYEAVAAAIAERDARDQGRAHAAGEFVDAVHIDTTEKAVDDIVEEILALLP
jgi:cytidylate kinase